MPRWLWVTAAVTYWALLGSIPTASAQTAGGPNPPVRTYLQQADDELTALEARCIAPGKTQQLATEEYVAAIPLTRAATGPTPRGLALLRHAADLGNVNAQFDLGTSLQTSYRKLSDHYLELAIAQGDARAQQALARAYYMGTGRERDFGLAFKYYSACAASGFADCATRVGNLYETGLGIDKDIMKAVSFYTRNASSPNFGTGARVRLAYIYMGSYPAIPRNPTNTAFSIALLSSPNVSGTETGDEYGTALLAWIYETFGQDGQVNPTKARELREMVARQHQFHATHAPLSDNGVLPTP